MSAPPPPAVSVPAVSVIVPVYRQWSHLPALMAALAAQAPLPGGARFEVLVVDNDPGPAPGGQPRPPLPDFARLVPAPRPGSYAARNVGAARAQGALLAFTDADCRPHPGWLAGLVQAAAAHPGCLLAGPVHMPLPPMPNRWEIFDAVRGIPQALFIAHGYAATANLAVPAALFAALGGFDAARLSGGDAEFCRRAGRAGHRLVLVPGAGVDHPPRASLEALATKARRIKGGQVAAGPLPRRLAWVLRSAAPPLREWGHYLRARPHPWRYRLVAMAVRLRLWGIELAEVARLLAGRAPPERR
jgi:GT2 family glycosyltransferase